MGPLEIGLIGTIALFAAILMGVNVMVALGAVGALGLTSVVGFHAATSMLSTVFFETTHSFHFSVIPLFLLMGYFAMRAGLGEDLFDAAHKWFGRMPGGLASLALQFLLDAIAETMMPIAADDERAMEQI